MGQKVNPHGLRVGVIKDWDSRWFAKDNEFGDTLVEDYNLRKFLKKTLYAAGIAKIEIERDATKVRHPSCTAPSPASSSARAAPRSKSCVSQCEKMINKSKAEKARCIINIVEVKQPDKNAQLVAENIAAQLENRISFRRAMKQAIGRAMRLGARGIKIQLSGRLGGAEIARAEQYHEGTIPLQTLRADIDYGFAEAHTTYGKHRRQGLDLRWRGSRREEDSQGRRQQVMLLPKRVKYRRVHRGRMKGVATRGNTVTYGEYGLQALEPAWITSNQIEAARVAMTRYIKRGGQVWIKIFPDKPITEKPAEYPNGFR